MREIVEAMAKTLSRFADLTHPALREAPLAGTQVLATGVTAHYRSDKPSLVKFVFMNTLNKGSAWEDSKQVAIEFDLEKLNKHGVEYIKGTIVQVTRAIEMYAAADQNKEQGVLTLH